MKKTYLLLAAAAMTVAATSCSKKAETAVDTPVEKTEVTTEYTGTMPGADVDAVRYAVSLTTDNDSVGTYTMTTEYVQGDSITQKFDEKGDFATFTKDGSTYVKLGDGAGATYFRCDADTAITMVNADLEAPVTGDYTLTKTK